MGRAELSIRKNSPPIGA
jgi:hypothetical protein